MGQVLHGSATTTHAVRAAMQRSQASPAQLSETYNINAKTVAKWRKTGFLFKPVSCICKMIRSEIDKTAIYPAPRNTAT